MIKYATQDNEQTYQHQYVYEVSVIGCMVHHKQVGNGIATFNRPINKEKKTWWITEVADFCNKEFSGKRKGVTFCSTWDAFIDEYLAWFENFRPEYICAHAFDCDHAFWKRTQLKFGKNKRMNSRTSIDKMFTTNAWKNCVKVCTQFLFDKDNSPKFCKNLKKHCAFVKPDKSNLESLMKWYYNDPQYRQPHTSHGDAMELFRLMKLRMILDGTHLPHNHMMMSHMRNISVI